MLVNRKDYNASIDAVAAAAAVHKKLRAEYVADIRKLGVDLRKKFCTKQSGCAWVHVTHESNPDNSHRYGIDVCIEGQDDGIIEAIINLMREEGWENPHVYESSKYATHIQAY